MQTSAPAKCILLGLPTNASSRTFAGSPDEAVRRCRDDVISDGASLPVLCHGLASAAVPPTFSGDSLAGVISGEGSRGCSRSVASCGGRAACSDTAGEPAMGVSAGAAGCCLDGLVGLPRYGSGCSIESKQPI